MHSLHPQSAPPPCCVPTRFEDQDLMFYGVHGVPTIRPYANMVVAECGCR